MARGVSFKTFEKLEILFSNNYKDLYELGLLLRFKGNKQTVIKYVNQFIKRHEEYIDKKNNSFIKTENYENLKQKRCFNPYANKIFKDLHYLHYETKTDTLSETDLERLWFLGEKEIDVTTKKGCMHIKDRELNVNIDFYNNGKIDIKFRENLLGYNYKEMLKQRKKEIIHILPRLQKKYNIYIDKDLQGNFVLNLKKGHVAFVNTEFQEWCENNKIPLLILDKDGDKVWGFDHSGGEDHLENYKIAKHPNSTPNVEKAFYEMSEGYTFSALDNKINVVTSRLANEEVIEREDVNLLNKNQVSIVETIQEIKKTMLGMQEEIRNNTLGQVKLFEKVMRFDILRQKVKTPKDYEDNRIEIEKLAEHEKDEIKKSII